MLSSTGGIHHLIFVVWLEIIQCRAKERMGTFIFWDRGSIELKNCFNSKSKQVLYKYSMQVSSASFTMMLFALYQFYMLCNSFFFLGGS